MQCAVVRGRVPLQKQEMQDLQLSPVTITDPFDSQAFSVRFNADHNFLAAAGGADIAIAAGQCSLNLEDMLLSLIYEDEEGDIPESSGAPGHEASETQCGDGDGVASTSIQGVAITPPSQTSGASGGTTNVTQMFVSTGWLPLAWSLGFAQASSASSSSTSSGQQ
ncbi:unnamed protein product [Symbiodinium natans]|uniref:Uncharacterized protein n=1 Tax=Symbiodinium natans TaxID=878477 RepID=A0A812PEV1_9DINO|nr:unnamed protein product [Symbiodinium natans]